MAYTTSCSFCGSILREVLPLGHHPHSDLFPKDKKTALTLYPLNLVRCTSCGLYQLDYLLPTSEMFNEDYLYDNSINVGGKHHWHNLASELWKRVSSAAGVLKRNPRALDIGSNSGELLWCLNKVGFQAEGIEPSGKPHLLALDRGLNSKNMLFNLDSFSNLDHTKYDCICFTNSFPHIPYPVETLKNASELLDKTHGIICIESPSSRSMIAEGQFDQIYHQHMTYLDFWPLYKLCRELGLKVIDFQETSFHNGSCCYYISHIDSTFSPSSVVRSKISDSENSFHKSLATSYGSREEDMFRKLCENRRKSIRRYIDIARDKDQKIVFASAPAKGNTLLNYCGITSIDIPLTTEANKLKIGRFTPLSGLPIVPDKDLALHQPDIVIVLAWNFYQQIKSSVSLYSPSAKMTHPFQIVDD